MQLSRFILIALCLLLVLSLSSCTPTTQTIITEGEVKIQADNKQPQPLDISMSQQRIVNPYFQIENSTNDVMFKVDHEANVYTPQMVSCDTITTDSNGLFGCGSLATVYYNATVAAAIEGTIDGGTITNTQHSDGNYDGILFNFTESAGSPGLDLRINFTNGITSFTQGVVRYMTSALSGDVPVIQLWDYDGGVWEDYPLLSESLTFATISQPVFDAYDHVSNGIVQMRLYKAGNGNINNHYYIDWLAISKGYGVPSGNEVDPIWNADKSDYYTSAETLTEIDNNNDTVVALINSLDHTDHGDGANCGAGEYPLGVDADGAVQSCTDATTEINAAVATKDACSEITGCVENAIINGTDVTHLNITSTETIILSQNKKVCLDGAACTAYIYYDGTNLRTSKPILVE